MDTLQWILIKYTNQSPSRKCIWTCRLQICPPFCSKMCYPFFRCRHDATVGVCPGALLPTPRNRGDPLYGHISVPPHDRYSSRRRSHHPEICRESCRQDRLVHPTMVGHLYNLCSWFRHVRQLVHVWNNGGPSCTGDPVQYSTASPWLSVCSRDRCHCQKELEGVCNHLHRNRSSERQHPHHHPPG